MTFSLTSQTPTVISSDGGREIVITGVFEAGHRYQVHIGDLGSNADPVCHSGIAGQSSIVYPRRFIAGGVLDTITAYSPKMNAGAVPYSIFVLDPDSLEAHVLSGSITVVKRQFFTTVYAIRHMQPPKYDVGPRRIDLEPST